MIAQMNSRNEILFGDINTTPNLRRNLPTHQLKNGNMHHGQGTRRVKVVGSTPSARSTRHNLPINELRADVQTSSKPRDALIASDDPPDHMEERARRMAKKEVFSRQRSDSVMSSSSMPSFPFNGHSLVSSKKESRPRQEVYNSAHSMARSGCSPILSPGISPLSQADDVLFPPSTSETNISLRPPRRKQQSPHPADVLKGQAAELKKKHQLRSSPEVSPANNRMCSGASVTHNSSSPNGLPSVDEIPNLTIRNNIESSETAEELRQLIEAMHTEFQRLRSSKIQAEVKAEQLQTDLSIQQQDGDMIRTAFESLSRENELLKSNANKSQMKLVSVIGKVNQVEDENRMLRGEYSKLKITKEVTDAKCVAAERRANAAEEEHMAVLNKMNRMFSRAGNISRAGSVPSPSRRAPSSSRSSRRSGSHGAIDEEP